MKRIFLIAAALLGIAYGPTASAVTAVAFSPSTDRYGVAWNEPDKETALRKAKEDCLHRGGAKDCKQLRVTEEKGFGAIAQTCAGDFCGLSVITGRPSAKQAEADAVKDCNSYYGAQDCRVYDNWEERRGAAVTQNPSVPPVAPTRSNTSVSALAARLANAKTREERTQIAVEYYENGGNTEDFLVASGATKEEAARYARWEKNLRDGWDVKYREKREQDITEKLRSQGVDEETARKRARKLVDLERDAEVARTLDKR